MLAAAVYARVRRARIAIVRTRRSGGRNVLATAVHALVLRTWIAVTRANGPRLGRIHAADVLVAIVIGTGIAVIAILVGYVLQNARETAILVHFTANQIEAGVFFVIVIAGEN
jgi:low affinity Fe/Cu permease